VKTKMLPSWAMLLAPAYFILFFPFWIVWYIAVAIFMYWRTAILFPHEDDNDD